MTKEMNNVNENILVTGGLGFIGSHYARLMVNSGYNVVIIDKCTYAADITRIDDIKDKAKLYIEDICDKELTGEIVDDNDICKIVNLCAETHVDNSIRDSGPFIQSNFVGVQNLLEISRRYDIKFIQISTDEVYGSVEEGPFKETDRLRPGNPYSACKAAADLLCLSYVNTYRLDICITRSSNNYGPYQHNEKFIPKMITDALNGKSLSVYGDGENMRDWLYVEDNCRAIKLVTEKGKMGEIYNIGGGNEMANNQIAKIISDRFNVQVKYIKDRPGHDRRYSIDSTKIKDELGWIPTTNFKEGTDKTIEYYVENMKDLEATKGYD